MTLLPHHLESHTLVLCGDTKVIDLVSPFTWKKAELSFLYNKFTLLGDSSTQKSPRGSDSMNDL